MNLPLVLIHVNTMKTFRRNIVEKLPPDWESQ